MKKAGLLRDAESFKTLGMNMDRIEDWEDGLRVKNLTHPGAFEWWYIDIHSDEGFVLVTSLHYNIDSNGKQIPFININLSKDGKVLCDLSNYHADKNADFALGNANVVIGKSFLKSIDGLNKYHIYIDPEENKGYGLDIILERQVPSYRPSSGISGYAENGPLFGWICAIPGGHATGKVMFDGQTAPIIGSGYHDHNWGECAINELVDNWFWTRGEVNGITIVASSTRFLPELGGGETVSVYMIKDSKLIFDAIDEEVTALSGLMVNHPNTNKPTPTKCSFTNDTDTRKTIVSFDKKNFIAAFPFDSSSTEWRCWYTRYDADVKITFFDKTNHTFEELKGSGTFEVMDYKGEWIQKKQ